MPIALTRIAAVRELDRSLPRHRQGHHHLRKENRVLQRQQAQLARYLNTDIVGARRAYQELTETRDVSDDGSPQILDLAETTW